MKPAYTVEYVADVYVVMDREGRAVGITCVYASEDLSEIARLERELADEKTRAEGYAASVATLLRERDVARADAAAVLRDGSRLLKSTPDDVIDRIEAYAAGKPVSVYTREDLARAWDNGARAGQEAGFYGDRVPPNPYGPTQPVSVEPDRETLAKAASVVVERARELCSYDWGYRLDDSKVSDDAKNDARELSYAVYEYDRAAGRKP